MEKIQILFFIIMGILVYLVISKICDTIYSITKCREESLSNLSNIYPIDIKSDKDLQKLLTKLKNDFDEFESENEEE